MTWAAIAVFLTAYALIATERINRVSAALLGAAGMVVIGVHDSFSAFHEPHTGIDWNVLFLLLGMMMIVSVMRHTGIFEYLAIAAVKRARGKPYWVMAILVTLTAVASALLDNVTTVLLIAPVTLLICDRLAVNPVPFLLAEVFASNIGGMATLVGDPPNIMIGSRAGLTFNDFLLALAPLSAGLLVVLLVLCRFLFPRETWTVNAERVEKVMVLKQREAITDKGLLIKSLIVLAAVVIGFMAHPLTHIEPSLIALLGAGLLVGLSRLKPEKYLEDVEWPTLVFFAGLFVMVGGLVEAGVMTRVGQALSEATAGQEKLSGTVLLIGSGVASGLVDNIPYVATMGPLVEILTASFGGESDNLWWALAIGADLGGNATAVGASANVVVMGIAARNGHTISFWQFTRIGLIVTSVTLVLAWVYWQAFLY